MSLNLIKKELQKKSNYLNTVDNSLSSDVKKLQKKLFDLLVSKTLSELTVKDGEIAKTAKNFALINNIDRVFEELNQAGQSETIKLFGDRLLNIQKYTASYYTATGFTKKAIENALQKAKWIENAIGYNGKEIVKGGYLDTLMSNEIVRQEIKDLMLRNIVAKTSIKDVQKELKGFVQGVGEQSGKLERYYKQYASDVIKQVDESFNLQVADELGLNHFAYLGTEIKTTRQFCADRYGQVFTREEAEEWDKEDWKGKSGSFFINRGGYNCRHDIGWISEKLYNELKG
jgi:hypothetical protein